MLEGTGKRLKALARRGYALSLRPDHRLDKAQLARSGLAAYALCFGMLPWLPVGTDGAMNGGQLLAHTAFNPAAGAWWSENPVGAALFITMPGMTIALCVYAVWELLGSRRPWKTHTAAFALPTATVLTASYPMLDQPLAMVAGVPIPQVGLVHIILIHGGLAAECAAEFLWPRIRK